MVEPYEEKLRKALSKYETIKKRNMKKNEVYRSKRTRVEGLNVTELPVDRLNRLAMEMSMPTG